MIDKEILAGMFRMSAERHFKESPLFSHLVTCVADDDDILEIARHANPKAFGPHLLMACVHSHLLGKPESELARFFPSVSGQEVPEEDPFPIFKGYVMEHRDWILSTIPEARVNKTIFKRSACFRAILVNAAQRYGWDRVHLVDIGCSAGLNLLMDQWRIRYGNHGEAGPADSPLQIDIEVREGTPPTGETPEIISRTGIDYDLFDLSDPAQENWLLGFLLPDRPEMVDSTRQALRHLRKVPPRFVQGSVIEELPGVLEALPENEPVVVMHSMLMYRLDPREKAKISRAILQSSEVRPSLRIGVELFDHRANLVAHNPKEVSAKVLGTAEHNAIWMTWSGGDELA